MKLGLGTAQFGLDYGATNQHGRLREDMVAAILARACDLGVALIDTAPAYGEAEALIGRHLPATHGLRVISKTRHFTGLSLRQAIEAVRGDAEASAARLKAPLEGLLVHHAGDLLGEHGAALWRAMEEVREDGLACRLGASVYNGGEVDALLARYPIDILQIPFSILDQRLLHDGTLDRLRRRGIEVHARSLLLQGVIAADPERLPAHLAELRPALAALRRQAAAAGRTPLEAALGFARLSGRIDVAILGVTTVEELEELAGAAAAPVAALDYGGLAISEARLVDPRRWPAPADLKRRAS
ncbi:MAG: aldo/keto reductase [Pseudomonadota bacterium]